MIQHIEAATQMTIGAVLAQIVLHMFGIELGRALALNAVMLGVSYARALWVRRLFVWIEGRA